MLKYIQSTAFIAGIFLFASCNLLDQQSPNDLDASDAIKDAASAEAALRGIYSSLQRDAYYGGAFPLMTEPLCDNAGTGGFQYLSLTQLGDKDVTPSNLIVEETWIAIYRTIANCNFLLQALPEIGDLEQAQAQHIEGQARALRALAHFDLLRTFGEHWNNDSRFGIPVISRVQSIEDAPSRTSVQNTYLFIIDELSAALSLTDPEDMSVQYINNAAIQALMARVYLYQKDYSRAQEAASAVIANPAFALLDAENYGTIFSDRRTSESVFELSFDNQNKSTFNGMTYSRDEALRTEVFYLAAASLNDFFQSRAGDVRSSLVNFDAAANDATILPDGRSQKYRGEDAKDNPAYIVRLAEMYLIRAEANGYPAGLTDLNYLRSKRGLGPATVNNAAEFEDAILAERRAEFNFEGLYYSDLARLGKYEAITGKEAFKSILPVPNREIIASSGMIEQNPGY